MGANQQLLISAKGGASGSTWNPADKAAIVNLSNNNLTEGTSTTGAGWVRATTSKNGSGKWYFEVSFDVVSASDDPCFGLFTPTTSLTVGLFGLTAQEFLKARSTYYLTNGNNFATGVTYANGDIGMIAFDAGAGKVWFGKNGTFTGSPSAGTGQTISGFTGAKYPVAGSSGSANTQITGRFASGFSFTPPTGFLAWG